MITRLLLAAAMVGLAWSPAPGADKLVKVRIPTLAAGSTTLINTIIDEKGFDRKHGIDIEFALRTGIPSYYADYRVGRFDAIVGGVGNALKDRSKGVDSVIIGGQAPTASSFLTRDPAIKSFADMRGKRLAAPAGSGNFTLARAAAGLYGVDLLKETQHFNVKGPAGGPTQLAAGRVDIAFSWEPAVSVFLSANPGVRIAVATREAYRRKAGHDSHHVVLYAHEAFLQQHPGVEGALIKAYADGAAFFRNNLEEALAIYDRKVGRGTAAIRDAFEAGRMSYSTRPASQEREWIEALVKNLVAIGFVDGIPPGLISIP